MISRSSLIKIIFCKKRRWYGGGTLCFLAMSNSILLNYHNGIPFDIELDVNWIAEIPDYAISPDDLYIVTYAKSGTTWTQQIVALIQRGGEKNQSHLMQVIPWLEIIGKEAAYVRFYSHFSICI